MTIDHHRLIKGDIITTNSLTQTTFLFLFLFCFCWLTHFLCPLSTMNKIEITGWWRQTMANRTKCENSSHYSASSKEQQGKSAHPVRSLYTPPLSTFAFSIESFFFFAPAAIAPLLHVGVLAVLTTNYDFQLFPRTIMDVVLFHPSGIYFCMGGTFLIMMRARHGKHKRNGAFAVFLIHIQKEEKKWHCERLRCITLVRSSQFLRAYSLEWERVTFVLCKKSG